METKRILLHGFAVTLSVALLSVASSAQSVGKGCSPAGTWYGGGKATAKYLGLATAVNSHHFKMVFHGAYDLTGLGFPVKTIWSGDFKKRKDGDWEYAGAALSLVNASNAFPPAGNPDIWVVHYKVRLEGCDQLLFEHDFFGGYRWDSGKSPLVDPPDYVVVPPPINETYHRLPVDCPACILQ